MTTHFLGLATSLLTRFPGIFAISRFVAQLAAEVGATLELSATDFTTADVCKPTRLVLQPPLVAHATFLGQERALRTGLVIVMAVMRHLWMTAAFWSFALEPASGWLGTTR